MSAALLNRFLTDREVEITVVESEAIPTIGVGEATIPSIRKFIRDIGLSEAHFLRDCSATCKLGIRFDGWLGDAHQYWHPFGVLGGDIDQLSIFHYWRELDPEIRNHLRVPNYTDLSVNRLAAEQGRALLQPGG